MGKTIKYTVEGLEIDEKIKLGSYLKFHIKLSGRLIKKAALEKRIKVNNKVEKLNYIVKNDEIIELIIDREETQNIDPEEMPLDIIYEDDDIIVINKRPGIVVHPTKSYPKGTLANGLIYYFRNKGEGTIVRLVSRLDMDTSGLILVAKNQFSHMALSRDMTKDSFKKIYRAIVHGNLKENSATIDLPIYRTTDDSIKRIVDERGQQSITHYKVIENYKDSALLELVLETGRTHQIRVHMSHIGHPLYGDQLYGNTDDSNFIKRQALHAYELQFPHPRSGNIIKLKAPIPEDMNNLIKELKD